MAAAFDFERGLVLPVTDATRKHIDNCASDDGVLAVHTMKFVLLFAPACVSTIAWFV